MNCSVRNSKTHVSTSKMHRAAYIDHKQATQLKGKPESKDKDHQPNEIMAAREFVFNVTSNP